MIFQIYFHFLKWAFLYGSDRNGTIRETPTQRTFSHRTSNEIETSVDEEVAMTSKSVRFK